MSTLFDAAGMAPVADAEQESEVLQNSEIDIPADFWAADLETMVRANAFTQLPPDCTDDLAHRFLQAGVESGALTHGFIFKGVDTNKLYATALLLAKLLNCQQPVNVGEACGVCTSCRWIKSNSHPAVMTLSRMSMWDEDAMKKIKERKKPLTKIVVSQVNELIRRLSMSSDAHRVVIVTDVSLTHRDEDEGLNPLASHEMTENLELLTGEHQLHFETLSRNVFDDSATNKLLKTLEEPSGRITFIFLAQQDEHLIDTIVSRCQVLPFAAFSSGAGAKHHFANPDLPDYIVDAVGKLEAGRHRGAITAEHFYILIHERLLTEYDCDAADAIQALMLGVEQVFIRQTLAQQPLGRERYETGIRLLERLTQAESQLKANVNPDGVLSRLRYDLADILSPVGERILQK